MKIGVCLSSRGLMFSKTTESIFANLKKLPKGYDYDLFMAHGLPIPTCFNTTIKAALEAKCDWLWLVEEDMEIPPDTLKRMLGLAKPVVTVDYADRRTGKSFMSRSGGKVLYSGMGCLLTSRKVLEKLEPPWCRTGVFWKVENDDGTFDWEYQPQIPFQGYGSQDIYLCHSIRQLGYQLTELVPATIGHMELLSKAEDVQNNGGDQIKTIYIDDTDSP